MSKRKAETDPDAAAAVDLTGDSDDEPETYPPHGTEGLFLRRLQVVAPAVDPSDYVPSQPAVDPSQAAPAVAPSVDPSQAAPAVAPAVDPSQPAVDPAVAPSQAAPASADEAVYAGMLPPPDVMDMYGANRTEEMVRGMCLGCQKETICVKIITFMCAVAELPPGTARCVVPSGTGVCFKTCAQRFSLLEKCPACNSLNRSRHIVDQVRAAREAEAYAEFMARYG